MKDWGSVLICILVWGLSFIPLPWEESLNNSLFSIFQNISFLIHRPKAEADKYLIITCSRHSVPDTDDAYSSLVPLIKEFKKLNPRVILWDVPPLVSSQSVLAILMSESFIQRRSVILQAEQRYNSAPFFLNNIYRIPSNASFILNQRNNLEVIELVEKDNLVSADRKVASLYNPGEEIYAGKPRFYFDDSMIHMMSIWEFLDRRLAQDVLKDKIILVSTGAPSVLDRPLLTPVGIMSAEAYLLNNVETRLRNKKETYFSFISQKIFIAFFLLILWALFQRFWVLQYFFSGILIFSFSLVAFWGQYEVLGWIWNYADFFFFCFACFIVFVLLGMLRLYQAVEASHELETLKTIVILQNKTIHSMKKLSDLGRMSSSIYHEISNPLHNLLNSLRMIAEETSLSKDAREAVDVGLHEIQRLQTLSQDLKQYYRSSRAEDQRNINLKDILSFTLRLLNHTFQGKNIEVETQFTSGNIQVKAEPDKLQQIFLNLLLNAIDAVESQGKIFVRLTSSEDSGVVNIQDTGPGIPENLRQDIFKPFFTTKKEHGSGLGLSVSQEIASNLGGRLLLKPYVEGQGAEFQLELPKI